MIEYEGRQYRSCGFCKGKGYKDGYEHVQGGVCFQCGGYKSVELYKIKQRERQEKIRLEDIEFAKSETVRLRALLVSGEQNAIDIARARMLKRYEDQLFKYGVTLPEAD